MTGFSSNLPVFGSLNPITISAKQLVVFASVLNNLFVETYRIVSGAFRFVRAILPPVAINMVDLECSNVGKATPIAPPSKEIKDMPAPDGLSLSRSCALPMCVGFHVPASPRKLSIHHLSPMRRNDLFKSRNKPFQHGAARIALAQFVHIFRNLFVALHAANAQARKTLTVHFVPVTLSLTVQ